MEPTATKHNRVHMSLGARKIALFLFGAIISALVLLSVLAPSVSADGEAPVLLSATPTSVSSVGGDSVTLTGEYFDEGATVFFDGVEVANVTFIDNSTLVVIVPAGVSGIIDITVKNSSEQGVTLKRALRYRHPAPSVTTVEPASASTVGGNIINIRGSGFFHTLRFKQLVGGDYHTCGLTSDYKVYCWGYNVSGQLGNGSTANSSVPVQVTASGALAGKTIVKLAAGDTHTLALDTDGRVYSWGSGASGKLGNGVSGGSSTVPLEVVQLGAMAGKTIVDIDAGTDHSLALDSEGFVYGWGSSGSGQLGIGPSTQSLTPASVLTTGALQGERIVSISAGQGFSLAASETGRVFSWGTNSYGQLGDGSTTTSRSPVAVTNTGVLAGKKITRVSAGWFHSVAIDDTGVLYAWGSNNYGQVGDGTKTQANTPVAVMTSGVLAGKSITTFDTARAHTVASDTNGAVYSWGWGSYGQNGVGSTSDIITPTAMNTNAALSGKAVAAISAGSTHSLIIDSSGEAYATGYNVYGQIGTGVAGANILLATAIHDKDIPSYVVTVDGSPASIDSRSYTSLSFLAPAHGEGKVPIVISEASSDTLSINDAYEYLAPPQITGVLPDSGVRHGGDTVVISGSNFSEGSVVRFGDTAASIVTRTPTAITVTAPAHKTGPVDVTVTDVTGQQDVVEDGFTFIEGVISISSLSPVRGPVGGGQTVTIQGNGLNPSSSLSSISKGGAHSCGIVEGRAYCWGYNNRGQLGDGTTTNSSVPVAIDVSGVLSGKTIVAITAGTHHTVALDSSGVLYAWGYGASGQLGNGSTANSSSPVIVDATGVLSGKMITAIAAGGSHTLALSSDGNVYSWGSNSGGSLGNGNTTNSSVPVAATGGALAGKTITKIAAGGSQSLAIGSDGVVYRWGALTTAQTSGVTSTSNTLLPVSVSASGLLAGKTAIEVSAGSYHALVLTSDNLLYAWGGNINGSLGNNTTTTSTSPVAVTMNGALAGKTVKSITGGTKHSVAITTDGGVYAWGLNTSGQLGDSSTTQRNNPVAVTKSGELNGKKIDFISAGSDSTLALSSGRDLYAWGLNSLGEFGSGTVTGSTSPIKTVGDIVVAPMLNVGGTIVGSKAIDADTISFVAPPAAAGKVDVSVLSYDGQSSTLQDAYEYIAGPVVSAVTPATGVKFGGDTVTILGSDFSEGSTVKIGGVEATIVGQTQTTITVTVPAHAVGAVDVTVTDSLGQVSTLANAFTYSEPTPALASITPTRGPVAGGQDVTISGSNFVMGESRFTQVVAGSSHSCGLTEEGEVYCWGANSNGQLGNSSTAQSTVPVAVTTTGVLSGKTIVDIVAGGNHSLALDSDGKVYSWGYNASGQLGNNSTTNGLVPVAVATTGALSGKTIVDIAAGGNHSLALDSDGKVYSWGYNGNGQLGNNSTVQSNVPVAVTTTGALSGKTIVSIAAGYYHSLVLDSDSKVYGWGDSSFGQLGNNSTAQSNVPVAVTTTGVLAGKTIVDIAASNSYALALDSDGKVYSWGLNAYGQLGNNSTTNSLVPVAATATGVLSGKTIAGIATGSHHSLAIDSDGKVYSWGHNASGQLGNNSVVNSSVPVNVASIFFVPPTLTMGGAKLTDVKFVSNTTLTAKTPAHSAGKADLTVTSYDGQTVTLSDAYEYISPPVATNISPDSGVKFGGDTVTIAGSHFSEGSTVRFGGVAASIINQTATTITVVTPAGLVGAADVTVEDSLGQKNTLSKAFSYIEPSPVLSSISPTRGPVAGGQEVTITGSGFVAGPATFAQVSAGSGHSLALDSDGTVYAWGAGSNGQLGNGSSIRSLTPVAITKTGALAGKTVTAIAAGTGHSLALDSDGKVYSWGYNSEGQLGNGSTSQSAVPVAVTTDGILAGKTIVAVAAGFWNSFALDSDGKVYSWGYNSEGQLGNNSTTKSLVPAFVTGALAGKTVTAISASGAHSLALDSDGTVYAWGAGSNGQLGNGSSIRSLTPVAITKTGALAGKTVTAIAAGTGHSLALDSDGKVYSWGLNGNGQLGNNSTVLSTTPVIVSTTGVLSGKTIKSISASQDHSIAIGEAGEMYSWGANGNGQLGDGSKVQRLVPVSIVAPNSLTVSGADQVSAGRDHSMVLDNEGNVHAWGYNNYGQLGNNSTTESLVPVASLAPLAKLPSATLGGTGVTATALTSDTAITGRTPAHAPGFVDLTITNYDGQAHTISNAYEYVAGPTITSVIANSGSIAGGNSIYVNGTGFTETSTVTIGGVTALVSYVNSTTLLVTVPASATPGEADVIVADEFGQSGSLENGYTYQLPAPTLTSVTPAYSKMDGGGTLTITGTGFVTKTGGGSWYTVTLDGVNATNVTVVNSTTITATIPAHVPGSVDVTLGGEYSETAVLSSAFTYLPGAYVFANEPRTVMATEPAEFTVEARDSNGQPVVSTTNIVLSLSSSTNTGVFAQSLSGPGSGWDSDSVVIPAGQSSATFYYRDSQKGTPTITVEDTLSTQASQQLTVLSRYKLLMTGITNPTNVGVPSSVTVQAVDYTGIAQTDYRGTVSFVSDDGAASLPSNYTFTAADFGRRTFTNGVVFGTQGTWSVTATDVDDGIITGTQSSILVGPPAEGEVSRLRFITAAQSFPLDSTSGVMTIQLQDTTGLPVATDSSVPLYIRSSSATGEVSLDGGTSWIAVPAAVNVAQNHTSLNFIYRDTTAGTHTLKVSQFADNDFGWGIAEQSAIVGVGAPMGIKINAPSSSPIGAWMPIEVGVRDASGNSVNAANDTAIELTGSENARYSQVATGENAQSTLEVTLSAGQQSVIVYVQATSGTELTITGTDARPLGDDDEPYEAGSVTVPLGSADPTGFIILAPTASIRVHESHVVAASLKDQFGNIVIPESDTEVTMTSNSNDGQYAAQQNGPWSNSITVVIPAGSGSASVYFKHTSVNDAVVVEVSADELQSASATVKVIAGVYSGKITFKPTNTSTTPASFVDTVVAGAEQEYTVQPIDAWGNPTVHTEPITIGFGGSAGETATWNGVAVTSPTTPAQAATTLTIAAGSEGATATYRNTMRGVATITAWDVADWEQYCVDGAPTGVGDGYICYTYGYRNNSKIQKDISIVADVPVGYDFETEAQVVAKNTASQPIVIQLVDQFGNETSFKAGEPPHALNLQSSSVTGEFSLSADSWQAVSEISFAPGVSQATVYYRDATVSSVEGYVLSTAGPLTAASQTIRIVEGFAAKAELDLDGQTTAVAGDYLPVTLRSTTSDGLEVVVLRDTPFALSGGQTGEFYTYNEANDTYSPITSVVLPAERSNTIVYYRATVTGEKTLRAAASGFSAGMAEVAVIPNVIQKLEYTQIPAGPARVEVTRASGGYAATTQDVFGNVVIADASAVTDIDVTSSHPTGEFSTSQQGGWGIATVPIPAGASTTQTFYYRNGTIDEQTGNLVDATALGEQTLTAHLDGVEDAEATITVVGLIATKIEFTSQSHTVVAGQKSEKVAVKLLLNEDGVDKPAVSTTDRTFAITSHESQSAQLFAGTYGKDMFTNENGDEITHVTIPAGSSTAHFYVTPKTAGSHRIQVSGAIYNHSGIAVRVVSAFQSISVLHAEPSQLVVRSAPQTLHPAWDSMPDEVSEPIKVVLADEFGNPATESSNRTISVTSSCESGEFLASPTGAAVQSITLTAGHSEAFAYYKDTESHAEPCTLIFSSSDVANGTQEITVRERVFEFVMTSQEQTVEAGQESQPIQVESRDRFGNAVTVEQAQTLRFSVTGEGNVLTPISATIPAGGTTATFTFRHTAAIGAETSYTVTATDQAGRISPASQIITVVPGVAARLSWEQSTISTSVGEYTPVRITVLNAYNMATSATSSITTSLTTNAGTNSATGQPAGEFYVKSTGDTYTPVSSVTIEQGAKQKLVYYRQTTTTKTRSLETGISGVIASHYGVWRESDVQKQVIRASAPGLVAVDGLVGVSPYRLGFSTGNFSAQARAFTPLKVTISGPLPQDLTVNLSSSTAGEGAGFYSANTGSTDEAIAGDRITSIVIPTGQKESATIYYRQDSLGSDYVNRPVQLNAEPLNAPWSTWSGQVYASMYLGAVSQIVITGGPSSLEQGETGVYSFETRDNLGNPVALVPYQPGYADHLQSPPTCLYVRVGSTEPKLTGSPGSNCAAPAGKDVAVISMKAGAKSGTFTYSDAVVGPHTVTVANSASGNSTLQVQKQVDITPAITTQVSFDKPQYALVRGDTINPVTVRLMSSYGRQVNTKGEVEVLITTTSATGLFKNPETGDWQDDLTVLIPAGQSSVGISYRDDSAPLGQATLSASVPSLQSGSAKVSLVTGNFSSVRFAEVAQTLERQQEGVFEIVTTDASGNEVPALTNMCFYITVPSPTATVSSQSTSLCQNVTLPGGATAHALYVASGTSRASFTLTDSNVGIYDISVSTQPAGGGVTVAQEVTIVDGDPVAGVFKDAPYRLERGGIVAPRFVLHNAFGAEVPAVKDMYFQVSSSSVTGQFAHATDDTWSQTKRLFMAQGESELALLYGDSEPIIDEYTLTAREVTGSGEDVDPAVGGLEDVDAPVFIVYGAPVQLAYTTPERTTIATHPSERMTVTLQNQYGFETITETDLRLYVRSTSQAGSFATTSEGSWGVTTITIPANDSSTEVYYRDKTEGVHTITVRDSLTPVQEGQPQGLVAAQDHEIVRQTFDHFVVTNIATPQKAGLPSSVVVFAVDSEGYVVEWYDGTIRFSSDSSDAIYPTDTYTFKPETDKGIHTFVNSVAFTQPGVKSVTVSDANGKNGTQYDIVVTAGNEAPVREIAIISPEVQPVVTAKNIATERITIQLRDSVSAPTNATGSSGYPVRLTTNSPTGRFATSPQGPWTTSLVTTVPTGLSFSTTPIYYRDSASGSHLITATDWVDATDNSLVANDELSVIVPEVEIESNTKIYSKNYKGDFVENAYLFAHTSRGSIAGYATLGAQAHDLQTGDAVVADWTTSVYQGSTLVDESISAGQVALNYRTPTLDPVRGSDPYIITSRAESEFADGAATVNVPISPWLAAISQVGYDRTSGIVNATLVTTKDANATDSLQATIFAPSSSGGWSLADLIQDGHATRIAAGVFQLRLPVGQLPVGASYVVVSLHDGIGITAQDSIEFEASTIDVAQPSVQQPSLPGGFELPAVAPEEEVPTDDVRLPGGGSVQPSTPAIPGSQPTDSSLFARIVRSPATPVAVAGALLGIVVLIAALLIYQAYKEWRRAKWLMVIIKKNQQTVADKNSFLQLASHHLRTPMTLIKASVEMLASNPAAAGLAQGIKVTSDQLYQKIEQIVEETNTSADLATVTATDAKTARLKILASPIFWLPVILSVILTVACNWLIVTYGGQVVGGAVLVNQVLYMVLGAVVLYTAVRQLVMRRERREQLEASRQKVDILNKAKINFAQRVQAGLSDDILRVGGYAQEAGLIAQGPVSATLSEGAERLKQLVSRFAVLTSIYSIAPVSRTFEVEFAVDEAIRELSREKDLSGLRVEDHTAHLALNQDRRLVTKLFETVIASMAPHGRPAKLVVDGAKEKDGSTTVRITGAASDEVPAENLFSVYSRADQEEAGTMRLADDQSMQRLDLYLDRLIVDSLGGDIDAKRSAGRMSVSFRLPALR